MMPVPIPDGVAEAMGGHRTVIGDAGNPADEGRPRPCEYVVVPSELYPGRSAVYALVVADDDERRRLAAGAPVWLCLDGGEVPWSLTVAPPPPPPPPPGGGPALLSGPEHDAVALAERLAGDVAALVPPGPSQAADRDELVVHVHAVQRMILAQAAARAYPDTYRLLGGRLP